MAKASRKFANVRLITASSILPTMKSRVVVCIDRWEGLLDPDMDPKHNNTDTYGDKAARASNASLILKLKCHESNNQSRKQ